MKNKTGYTIIIIIAVGIPLLFGCSGGSDRKAVEGTVTLDGKPLEKGYVSFRPQQGTKSPSGGANVVNGEFSIDPERGLLPGKFRVEITASRPTGRQIPDRLTGKMMPFEEQYIPAKYNNESKLETEIGADEPRRLEFAITSK